MRNQKKSDSFLDADTLRLLGQRAKLDSTKYRNLPLLINEDWGSEVLAKAYRERLSNPVEDKKLDDQ